MPVDTAPGFPPFFPAWPSFRGVVSLDAQRHEITNFVSRLVRRHLPHFGKRAPDPLEGDEKPFGRDLFAARLVADPAERRADRRGGALGGIREMPPERRAESL